MRAYWTVVVALAALMVPASGFAQASIAGAVKDTSGAVLPGVTVEASSSALIEKTRSVVTDGTGQYRIENLRPGTYTVTFVLPGFNTAKRDGVELTGSFAATINVELRVGALEETITVTGETPVVDVQSATRQRVVDRTITEAIPAGRLPNSYATLIPGMSMTSSSGSQDVGGSALSGNLTSLSIHGISGNDMRTTTSGVNYNTVGSFGSLTPAMPNMAAIQEVTVDYASVSAELGMGGVRINFIPREGGNTFAGTFFGSFTNDSLSATNFSDDLKARGLITPDKMKKNWDINPGFGGPIKKDKLWFFGAGRYNGSQLFTGGMFHNTNANNPSQWAYVPDTSRPASNDSEWADGLIRFTWQANAKNKVAVQWDQQKICNCLATVSATQAPEAGRYWHFPFERAILADWTSPLTNRILLEGAALARHERYIMDRPRDLNPLMINVLDQSNNRSYRARDQYADNWTPNFNVRFAASYITGAHAVKVGFNRGQGSVTSRNFDNQPVSYRVNTVNGVPIPNQITLRSMPFTTINKIDHDAGIFAQDKWSIGRLTTTFGVRFDFFRSSFGAVTVGPSILTPSRDISLPETKNLGWNDVTPKFGASYDLFGDRKTALKVSANKYVAAQGATGGLGNTPSPVNRLVLTTNRAWTDANGDYVPQCNLTAPAANGECGAMANANFGRQVPGTEFDPDVLRGWGHRGYNWEFSAGVQHELLPRVSVDFSYFRRVFGNFIVTDNLAVAASDYDRFTIAAPTTNSALPNGGKPVTGLFDLNPSKFGIPTQNYVTFTDAYGKQTQHWDGYDLTVNARPRNGILLQGGMSSGKTSTDVCDVAAEVPEALQQIAADIRPQANNLGATPVAGTWLPLEYCKQVSPFLTQFKMLGSYTVPKVGVLVSATFQSVPGPLVAANYNVPTAVAAQALGRPLSGNAANITVNVLEPGSLFGDRLNQLDLRLGKILRFSGVRSVFSMDIYNALNGDAVLTQNDAFAVWQRPSSVITARFVKFSVQVDF